MSDSKKVPATVSIPVIPFDLPTRRRMHQIATICTKCQKPYTQHVIAYQDHDSIFTEGCPTE